ncbi:MAG: dynamin family protein [Saprospiraceae bacterium]|nr:dynamin family protein [Saprospiraceae bacterium]
MLDTDKEICKVAPMPMTDTIQQILFGEEERIETINPYLKKIYQPVEILREIAIVDTPGTNTIVQHHQEITEKFIPYSDLIVFCFEAKTLTGNLHGNSLILSMQNGTERSFLFYSKKISCLSQISR